MKTLYLSIIIVLMLIGVLVVPSAQNAKAIPYFSPQELYNLSDMVFYGEVLTKGPGPGPDYYYYQVQVITYFKNQQTSDTITVAGHKPGDPRAPYPQFEVGDNAVFYIRKTDGINTIYWNSQKAGNACNMQSFLESSPISTNPKTGPTPSTHIYIEDAKGIMPYIPLTNHTAVFHDDDVWNNYPESRTVPVTLSIRDEVDGQQVFNQTQTLEMQACSGPGKVQWNFVPTQIEYYMATVTDDKSKISMSFNSIYNSAADSQIILPPLKQFKSGVAPKDIKCNDDLQLIFKTEDNSPACVKTDTAFRLSALGWGNPPSPFITKTDLLNSTISGGKIKEFQYDPQSASIIIKIQTVSDGSLIITIPKIITDLNPSHKPFKDFHTVLVDGMEENIDLVPTANGSSFTIPFTNGTQEIEIIGNQVGQQN